MLDSLTEEILDKERDTDQVIKRIYKEIRLEEQGNCSIDHTSSRITSFLESIRTHAQFDLTYKMILENLLLSDTEEYILLQICDRIYHPYSENLSSRLQHSEEKVIFQHKARRGVQFQTRHHTVRVTLSNALICSAWNQDFSQTKIMYADMNDPDSIINQLLTITGEENASMIKNSVHLVAGPTRQPEKDLVCFIDLYRKHDLLLDFFEWKYYPFEQIEHAPDILTEIILRNSATYLYSVVRKPDPVYMGIPFNQLPAPLQLLYCQLFSLDYTQEMMEETIRHYQTCRDPEIRQGVFEIIYYSLSLLDPKEIYFYMT